MDKTQAIIFAAAMAYIAVRLYQKYIKKNEKSGSGNNITSSSSVPDTSKDDEYEPYSKK
jgi:hypothetical protein